MKALRASSKQWITASEIGSVRYCPRSLYLRQNGASRTLRSRLMAVRGNRKHQRLTTNARLADARRCYIATYAFGSQHPYTELLRYWRDTTLLQTFFGKLSVSLYYWVSPKMIRLAGDLPSFRRLSRRAIRWFIRRILA